MRDTDSIDELRRFIRDHPRGMAGDEARSRITELEYRAADNANTRYAYNTFLERHGESSQAIEVRRKLEQLDFDLAKAKGDPEALAAFLRRHSGGRLADRARRLRWELLCTRWTASDDLEGLRGALLRLKNLPCRSGLEQRLKQMELDAALSSGQTADLIDFTETYGNDPLTAKARAVLLKRQSQALIQAALFDRSRQLINSKADADQAEHLFQELSRAQKLWARASFDAQAAKAAGLEQLARQYKKNRRGLTPLRDATKKLRSALDARSQTLPRMTDPRKRWVAAERIGQQGDEAAADALFELMGDAYLEVRRRAIRSLSDVLQQLGPIRGQVWLGEQRNRLKKTARAGILLFKLAMLESLSNDSSQALGLLTRMVQESEKTDLLALHSASQLSAQLGLGREAAAHAMRFCKEAQSFARQRMRVWSEGTNLRGSRDGWLILRQQYGLKLLWADLLQAYQPGPKGLARLDDHRSILGPWLGEGVAGLQELESFQRNEESRWARLHPGYEPSHTPSGPALDKLGAAAQASLLGIAGGLSAVPTLRWAACCHPDPKTRDAAARGLALGALVRLASPLSALGSP